MLNLFLSCVICVYRLSAWAMVMASAGYPSTSSKEKEAPTLAGLVAWEVGTEGVRVVEQRDRMSLWFKREDRCR